MKLEITEEWDGETLWNQEELVAFAPEIALAAEPECDEDCDCEDDEEAGNRPNFKIGDRVEVRKDEEHDSMTKERIGTITTIGTPALGVLFDGEEKEHRWYVASELELMDKNSPEEKTEASILGKVTNNLDKFAQSLIDITDKSFVHSQNLSNAIISTVIKENAKIMIKDFSELTDEVMKQVSAAEVKALHESHANSILKMYEDKIREASEKFVAEQNAHANKLKEVEDAKAALLTKVEELSTIKAEFEKLLAEKKALATQEVFSSRMASFDLEYELNDDERKVIAEDIKDLDEAAFAKFQDKMKVMMKEKMKANKGKKACAESVASADVLADAIDAGKKDTVTVPHTSTAEETLADKAKRVFGGDFISIKS